MHLWASWKASWKRKCNLTMREKFHCLLWQADISQCLIPPWGCIDSSPKNILRWHWSRFLASCFLAYDFQNLVLARHFGSVWSKHTAFLWLYWLCFGTVRTNFSSAEPKDTWFLKDAPKIADSVSFYAWEESERMGHILVLAWIFWGHLGSSDAPRESSGTAWVMWEAKPDLNLVFCIKTVTLRRVGEGHWLVGKSLEEPGSWSKVQPTVLCEQVLWRLPNSLWGKCSLFRFLWGYGSLFTMEGTPS